MEFLLFLNSYEKEILALVQKANYQVEENTPLCLLDKKFFGFLKKRQKRIVICTKNAMDYGGYNFIRYKKPEDAFKTGLMIRRALRHEAIHVAQECNNGNLVNSERLKLSPYKLDALKASAKLTGEYDKEYEAYSMEDKPRAIISALKRYCL